MDADQLFELCYLTREELIDKLLGFIDIMMVTEKDIQNIQEKMYAADLGQPSVSVSNDLLKLYSQMNEAAAELGLYKYSCVKHGLSEQFSVIEKAFLLFIENTAFLANSWGEPADNNSMANDKARLSRLNKYCKNLTKEFTANSKKLASIRF